MKRFLIKFFTFAFTVGAVVWAVSYFADCGLRKSRQMEWAAWNDIFGRKIEDNVIILGSSRGYGSFNPAIIEPNIKTSCRNLSMTGYTISQIMQRYKAYVSLNKKPAMIILNVDYHVTFEIMDYAYDLSQYLPYYNSPYFDDYLNSIGIGWSERNLPLLKYSDFVDKLWIGIKENFKASGSDNYKGYANGPYEFNGFEFRKMQENGEVINTPCQENAFKLCDELIEDCLKRGIRFAFCKVPYYYEATKLFNNTDKIDNYLNKASEKYNIPLFDYSHSFIEKDSSYFSNATHLNEKGAIVVSEKLGKDIALSLNGQR